MHSTQEQCCELDLEKILIFFFAELEKMIFLNLNAIATVRVQQKEI